MKKNNLSLSFLGLVIAIFFTLFACRKSIESSLYPSDLIKSSVTERQDLDFALTTSDVYFEQGMLCFKDSATLNAVWASLKKLSKDSTFNKNYRTQMGILSPNSPQDDAFPYEPAYHAFGQRFSGFTSLYKFQEDEEYNFLENGGSFEDIPEPDMDDEELISILNANKEVKVGKLIYKYLNENQFFVITANDFSRIPVLRALSNPLAEKRIKNASLIDSRIIEDMALYKKIVESSKPGSPGADCEASIAITKVGENTYKATNTSMLYECEQTNIVWRVSDGNNNILYSISQVDEITYTLPLNVVLPVYVSINVSGECCQVFTREIMAGEPCIEYDGISMGLLGPITTKGTEYSFQINGLGGISDYTVTWDFGDNSSVLSSTTNTINHTYDFDGGQKNYTVTCTIS